LKRIRKCARCGAYTLSEKCPRCGGETKTAHPPKFSPEDKWAEYRRRFKFPEGEKVK